jgi:hypothetical protein
MTWYLQNSTRPNISMAVHQMTPFSNQPMLSHKKAIIRIGRYFLDICSHGIVYKPDTMKGLKCYINAHFTGGWSQADLDNAENVISRTGYIITYAGCPIHWVGCLQMEIALSTAEAE